MIQSKKISKCKKNIHKTQSNKLKFKKGGKMLASGGFGCVFSPALKCKRANNRQPYMVSKLMTSRHVDEEFNEITKMKNKLKNIPNYQNYYLVDNFSVCKPDKLTNEDLVNFDKCTALSKTDMTSVKSDDDNNNITHLMFNEVNTHLKDLKILNMPFGGIPLDEFILKHKTNINIIYNLNIHLLDLLKNGIIPLNNNQIYHNDIKDSNVLVHLGENYIIKTRLIDWGLSCTYKPNDPIPKPWENRPFQFNVPFSVILFTDLFMKSYKEFINSNQTENLFVKNYINKWKKKRGKGHMSYIKNIFKMLGKSDTDAEDYIIEYIVHIVRNLSESFKLIDYLNNVFIKIIDIWGFITLYIPLLELFYDNFENLNYVEKKIYEKIKYIFMEFLYKPRIARINIAELIQELVSMNYLIMELKK